MFVTRIISTTVWKTSASYFGLLTILETNYDYFVDFLRKGHIRLGVDDVPNAIYR